MYSLCAGIESTLDDIRSSAADTDDGANPEGRNGSNGIVHRVIADVTMFTVDNDALRWARNQLDLFACPSTSAALTSSPVKATIWAWRTDGMAMKVIKGYSPALSLLRSLRRELETAVV